jgi:hypothetical protein
MWLEPPDVVPIHKLTKVEDDGDGEKREINTKTKTQLTHLDTNRI